MEGEEERSENEGSFSKASIPKRIAIVMAGATVNILFGLIVYFILMSTSATSPTNVMDKIIYGGAETKEFVVSVLDNLKMMATGGISVDQMMGPVGISEVVVKTNSFKEFVYMLAVISLSLGVTNLLPIPALDGGKILLLIIEAIRRKPLKESVEIKIQLLGFSILIALSLYITYNETLIVYEEVVLYFIYTYFIILQL